MGNAVPLNVQPFHPKMENAVLLWAFRLKSALAEARARDFKRLQVNIQFCFLQKWKNATNHRLYSTHELLHLSYFQSFSSIS